MNSLDKARGNVARALDGAQCPIVCWSGGKDSQLLLRLANEVMTVPALWFRSVDRKRNKFAEQFLVDNPRQSAHHWEPADRYVLPNGEGMSIVEEYSFGNRLLPLVSDIAAGEKCVFRLPKDRVKDVNYDFDVTLVGMKALDAHPLVAPQEIEGCIAPLWHMTDGEVWAAIRELDIPVEDSVYDGRDPDGPSLCVRCLMPGTEKVFCPDVKRSIMPLDWPREDALAAFNFRFKAA